IYPARREVSRGGNGQRDRGQPASSRDLSRGEAFPLGSEARFLMAMETRLSLRQSQRVVMTPLLQQAIQLLQLSTLELQEVVQKELLENPLLEEMQPETADQPDGKDAPPDVPTAPPAEPLSSDAAPTPTTERQTDDLPFDLTAVIFDDHEERSLVAQEDREDLPFENMVRSVSS